jgi:hypothetical protein
MRRIHDGLGKEAPVRNQTLTIMFTDMKGFAPERADRVGRPRSI